jgi:hypothetical protein
VVEHDLAKVGVEGSNPFARSNLPIARSLGFSGAFVFLARLKLRVAKSCSEARVTGGYTNGELEA